MKRRTFIEKSGLGSTGLISASLMASCIGTENKKVNSEPPLDNDWPKVIATWNVEKATAKAWSVLNANGKAIDAVEMGVRVEEADIDNQTVGKGGRPDRDGNVTLDACIMDSTGNCGSVVYLQNVIHPVSVARKVMEDTPHVILAGKGAEQFAYEKGFPKENLLTEKSRLEWLKWQKEAQYEPVINIENHDTIGMLTLDKQGNLSGACTTSGAAYKMAGRVGDSPIIGAGLFVDNAVGGATATGLGEAVLRTVGSFLVVELMRQGSTPQEACKEAVHRIVASNPAYKELQVGYIAMNKQGITGGYCLQPGFGYRVYSNEGHEFVNSESFIKS